MIKSMFARNLALGVLLLVGVSGVFAAQPPANQPVTVTNTLDNAVPVTGSVIIGNTMDSVVPVAGSVDITNTLDNAVPVTGSVIIGNTMDSVVPVTGSVTITNSVVPVSGSVMLNGTPSVRDADNPAFQPFVAQLDLRVDYPDSGGTEVIATVPEGKRLVIETVSAFSLLPAGQDQWPNLSLEVCTLANCISHYIPMEIRDRPGGYFEVYTGNQAVRYYADPGSDVSVRLDRGGDSFFGSVHTSLSGYLVDLPQ